MYLAIYYICYQLESLRCDRTKRFRGIFIYSVSLLTQTIVAICLNKVYLLYVRSNRILHKNALNVSLKRYQP